VVVLSLIQIGGLGYMSIGSFILLIASKKLSLTNKALVRNSFGLPDHFNAGGFVNAVMVYTLSVEFLGALVLWPLFAASGAENPLWQAVFHSISSFCTAGFSLFNTSLETYYSNPLVNIVIAVISLLGAMGFLVTMDFWQKFRHHKPRITSTSKIILVFTLIVTAIGTIMIFFTEPAIARMPFFDRFWISFFQAVSASTTVGFDTYPTGQLAHGVLYCLLVLMVLGASPAGTGGGIEIHHSRICMEPDDIRVPRPGNGNIHGQAYTGLQGISRQFCIYSLRNRFGSRGVSAYSCR